MEYLCEQSNYFIVLQNTNLGLILSTSNIGLNPSRFYDCSKGVGLVLFVLCVAL